MFKGLFAFMAIIGFLLGSAQQALAYENAGHGNIASFAVNCIGIAGAYAAAGWNACMFWRASKNL